MNTLIEIHVLQNFAPSNLNRDDTGAPKDALFGGTRRARISSQCLKRAVRQHFREMVEHAALASDDIALRTKRVADKVADLLAEKGKPRDEAMEKVKQVLGAMELSVNQDGKTEYLIFWRMPEISKIASIINEQWESIAETSVPSTEGKKAGKAKKQAANNVTPELKKTLDKVFDGGKALDVALFGRMLADMPEKNQDAACQVAHAISTHSVEREFDFYTAVDDFKPEDTAGADMMGTVEFNSACYYRYAVLDWQKLVENLYEDAELAAKGVQAFLKGFVVAEPSGKQNTFAAHNSPEFVAVSVRRNSVPRNLANAFEMAVRVRKDESITKESATKLVGKAKALAAAFGGNGETYVLDLVGADLNGFGNQVDTLDALLTKTMSALNSKKG